ncbi:MAG: hydratase [Actinobacteria bacterium]|nr:hydratase [Actinomycetota bacterium]
MRSFTVAAVQCASAYLDPVANASLTEGHIRAAAAQGAQLVVLPELVASSYAPGAENFTDLAESASDPGYCLSTWIRLAAELNVGVIAGFLERSGDQVFNSAVVVDPKGQILDVYRKLHLFGAEQNVFSPGDRGLPIVEIHGARVGVQVCYDLRFPETLRILALRGAEVVAVPTAWTGGFDKATPADGRIGQVDGALVQSNLNQLFLVCADQVGKADQVTFLGRSIITTPYGEAVAGPLSPTDEAIAVVKIDLDDVQRARHRGPGIDPFENRRTDVYAGDLGYQEPVKNPW